MIRHAIIATLIAAPAMAQDFSANSEAKEWGLFGERKARFEAHVVDLQCAVTGDCPEDCGAGLRPMVLIRAADGAMVLALKNGQPVFSGATFDLAPWCAQTVEIDGVLVGDPEITPAAGNAQLYMVQRIRAAGEGEWQKADAFTGAWAERFPDAAGGEGAWYRRDPRIAERIEAEGYLGLGPETDAAFIEENN